MEQSEFYFRERAQAERAIACDTSSPQARRAHLELALRYVKAAEALYVSTRGSVELSEPSSREQGIRPAITPSELAPALGGAFPLPASGAFSDLLSMLD
jgi:hypothetical protein